MNISTQSLLESFSKCLRYFVLKNLALHPYPSGQSRPRDVLILIIFGKMLAGHNGSISPPDSKTCSAFSQPVSSHPSGSARSPLSLRHGVTSRQESLGVQSQASVGNNGNNPGVPMRRGWDVCCCLLHSLLPLVQDHGELSQAWQGWQLKEVPGGPGEHRDSCPWNR